MIDLDLIKNFSIDKSDWVKVKFGDIAYEPKESVKDPVAEGIEHVVGLEHIDSEDIHLRRSASIEESTTFTKRFRKGDVLFGRRRAYLKKAAKADFEGICSGDITVMRANEELLLPELLPFIVNNDKFFDYAIEHSAGGLSPRVKFKDLSSYEFLLPSKEQQLVLVDILQTSTDFVEKEIELLSKISILRESLFRNLVQTSKGKMKPLSQILIPQKAKSKVPHEREKYIGLEHVVPGEFSCSSFSNTDDVLATCNIVNKGDLCYSKLRPYLDKAFIADFDAISTTELLIYDTQEVTKEYVLYHFHSRPFIDYVSGKTFGTKMPRTSHKVIGEYEVKVCDNEAEILNKMEVLMNSQQKIKQKIESSNAFKKSIINQVF